MKNKELSTAEKLLKIVETALQNKINLFIQKNKISVSKPYIEYNSFSFVDEKTFDLSTDKAEAISAAYDFAIKEGK